MTGIIYRATSPNNKNYIGKTTRTLQKRKREHIARSQNPKLKTYHTYFSKALRKYDANNFTWTILHQNVPEVKLDKLEQHEIKAHDSRWNGYNLTYGGDGGATNLGKKMCPTTRKKMSKNNCRYWLGKTQSSGHRKKNSEANMGEKNHFYGKKHTPKTRAKMSKNGKGKNSGVTSSSATTYKVQHPSGKISKVITRKNLQKFCEQNHCSFSMLIKHKNNKGYALFS